MTEPYVPNPTRTFTKDVMFKVPTKSGGFQQVTLKVDYKSLPKGEAKARQQDPDFDDDLLLREVVTGVHGVGDGQGGTLEPADALEAMLVEPSFCYEAALTYYDAVLGGNLKKQTSKARRGTG